MAAARERLTADRGAQLLLNNSEGDLLSGRVLTFARFNRDLPAALTE